MTAAVATMIKPWQKASLGVIVSVGVYGAFLHSIQAKTSHANHVLAQVQADQQEHQILLTQLKREQAALIQLHLSLSKIHEQTLQTRQQINLINSKIQKLQSGIQVANVQASQAATAKVVTVSTPNVSVATPPPVQTVTKASGAP